MYGAIDAIVDGRGSWVNRDGGMGIGALVCARVMGVCKSSRRGPSVEAANL